MIFSREIRGSIQRTRLWSMARRLSLSGDTRGAILALNRMEAMAPLRPRHLAYRATLRVDVRDRVGALADFTKALELTENPSSASDHYIRLYSLIFVTSMTSEESVESMIIDACNMKCPRYVRAALPLTHLSATTAAAKGHLATKIGQQDA